MPSQMLPDLSLSESWSKAIRDLEWSIACGLSEDRPSRISELAQNLRPLVDLTRQIAATRYGRCCRAGTSLRETLIISTAAKHGLEPDEPHITVSIERTARNMFGFCILYFERGEANENIQALVKTYRTDDNRMIEANLRRDMANFYYPCEYANAWETLQPLLVRLWNETHP